MTTLPKNRHAMFGSILAIATVGLFALGSGCSTAPSDSAGAEEVGEADEDLSILQCLLYEINGKTTICHATNSTTHPYTVVKTSVAACIAAHSLHSDDYIAVGDPTCQGGGCLPQGAPCDATLPCCSGATCVLGLCLPICNPTTCEAQGATCGTIPDGCGDTLNCGSCTDPETFGGGGTANVCGCTPTTCEAQGANCGTIPDGCGGTLSCGAPCGPVCPCAGNPAWEAALDGTIVNDGRCTNYSFPAPCHTSGSFSWAVSDEGTSVVEFMAGTAPGPEGDETFCGVQVMNVSSQFPGNCSGGAFPVMMTNITAAEAASCRADIANFAAAQSVTCN